MEIVIRIAGWRATILAIEPDEDEDEGDGPGASSALDMSGRFGFTRYHFTDDPEDTGSGGRTLRPTRPS